MKGRVYTFALLVGLFFAAALVTPALSEDFYAGKTIRVIVGFAPGGGYDTYARAVARHMGKHIPGNPGFVVENMDGAGSLIAANYTYAKAQPDGLTIGVWNSAYVLYQVLGDPAVRIDSKKLSWIGSPVKGSPSCGIMGFTGLKTIEDVLKSGKELKMGATRAGSTLSDVPWILNATVGTKFNVITGYKGSGPVRLAMQGKEVDGACFGWESIRATAKPILNAQGDDRFIMILNHSKWEDPEVKDVPLTRDFIKAKAGDEGLALYNAWVGQYEFQRPWVAPPAVPQDRLTLLRKAFVATLQDPEFLADAKKSKLDIDVVPAEEIYEHIEKIVSMSPKNKDKLQFLVKKPQ